MVQIGSTLKKAGWLWESYTEGVGTPIFSKPGYPQAGIVAFNGLAIQIADSQAKELGKAVVALKDALAGAGIEVSAKRTTDGSEKHTAIHIYIGSKM
jgi:hypothetical protein